MQALCIVVEQHIWGMQSWIMSIHQCPFSYNCFYCKPLLTCIPVHLAHALVRGLQYALHTFQLAKAFINNDHSKG